MTAMNQMKANMLENKNTIEQIRNSVESLNNRMSEADTRISEVQYISFNNGAKIKKLKEELS